MASYGRNFDFRILPDAEDRKGRFILTSVGAPLTTPLGSAIPIGVPVTYDSVTAVDANFTGLTNVKLATGAQAPVPGMSGIALYEHAPAAFTGFDPFLTTYSDIDFVPVGRLLQVISGHEVKVLLRNTNSSTFLNTRTYAGRTMVAGVGGATPTIAVGDLLTPGTGTDNAGYWAETAVASDAWLRVISVDNSRLEVEAQLLF